MYLQFYPLKLIFLRHSALRDPNNGSAEKRANTFLAERQDGVGARARLPLPCGPVQVRAVLAGLGFAGRPVGVDGRRGRAVPRELSG
jgi:hypothetical protein